jgi:hypothetical protein
MQVKDMKSKLDDMLTDLDELIEEFGSETNPGSLLIQCQTQLVQVRRTVGLVLASVEETEEAAKDVKVKESLPKKAPTPASKVDKGA